MKIKKLKMNNYDAVLHKTDKYTTLYISYMFEMDYTKENLFKTNLLFEYMLNTNKIYKTKKDIHKKVRKMYDMGLGLDCFHVGKKLFMEVKIELLDPKLVKDDYLEEALDFAYDMVFNPNFIDGHLDSEVLEIRKTALINSMGSRLTDPNEKILNAVLKSFLPNTYHSEDIVESKEEYKSIIDSFTDSDLVYMYNKIFKESFIGSTMLGNFDDKTIELLKTRFVFKNVKPLDTDYDEIVEFNYDNKYQEVSDDTIMESKIFEIFSIKDYTIKDVCAYDAIKDMLNGVGMLMHRVLREDLNIVYNANASFSSRSGYLLLRASIGKESKDKALEGFKTVLKKLEEEEYVETLLERCKKELELNNYTEDENINRVFDHLLTDNYKWDMEREKYTKKFMELTSKDIIEGVKRLKSEGIFFYRGDYEK